MGFRDSGRAPPHTFCGAALDVNSAAPQNLGREELEALERNV